MAVATCLLFLVEFELELMAACDPNCGLHPPLCRGKLLPICYDCTSQGTFIQELPGLQKKQAKRFKS